MAFLLLSSENSSAEGKTWGRNRKLFHVDNCRDGINNGKKSHRESTEKLYCVCFTFSLSHRAFLWLQEWTVMVGGFKKLLGDDESRRRSDDIRIHHRV